MPDEPRELKPMTFFQNKDKSTSMDSLTKDWTPKMERIDQPEEEGDAEERRAPTLHEGPPDEEQEKKSDSPSTEAPDEEPMKGDGEQDFSPDLIPQIEDSPDLPTAQDMRSTS